MSQRVTTGANAWSRRSVLAGMAGAPLAACGPRSAAADARDLIWGVNGHPLTAYGGIPYEEQLDLLLDLGMKHYRVNTRRNGSPQTLAHLLDLAEPRGITIVPVLFTEIDLWGETRTAPQTLYDASFEVARRMTRDFRGRVRYWGLANELESYAIIRPCEMEDDGTQYPCEWGPAGGVEPSHYYTPRWTKVSAILKGLSEGALEGDPTAKRLIGTAGWGHLGAFERMVQDGITWDITTWHDYEGVREEYLRILASYGKPIWITEFNAGGGGEATPRQNARMLAQRMAYYRRMRAAYGLEAAFVYELLDEDYFGDTNEARLGLYEIEPNRMGDGWRIGAPKPAAASVRNAIRGQRPGG